MNGYIVKFFSVLGRLAPVPILTVAIASSFVIFIPDEFALKLGLAEFRIGYKGYLGWCFVFAWSYLLAIFIWYVGGAVRSRILTYHSLRILRQYLNELTPEEKGYLREFIAGENTIYYNVDDGIAGGLELKQIIFRSSNMFSPLTGIPYNLQPWPRRYITKHPHVLKGAVKRKMGPGM